MVGLTSSAPSGHFSKGPRPLGVTKAQALISEHVSWLSLRLSAAFRYSSVTFETWNDLVNQKDYGPTFGARLTVDLLDIYHAWRNRS